MKKSDITYIEKLNELRLTISHPNNKELSFVLVEGDSDIRFFRKFFSSDACKVECMPGGSSKVEAATAELLKNYTSVIGIRDADFIHLNQLNYPLENMFLTDFHDMEMTLIANNDAFSSIFFEYTNTPKESHDVVRQEVLEALENISLLKWLNENENLGIKFESDFQDLISFSEFKIDFEQYFGRVLSKSSHAKISEFLDILEQIQTLKLQNPDPYQLTNGHDCMKVISAYIRIKGNNNGISHDKIASSFRISYTVDKFKETKLYASINSWSEVAGRNIFV